MIPGSSVMGNLRAGRNNAIEEMADKLKSHEQTSY